METASDGLAVITVAPSISAGWRVGREVCSDLGRGGQVRGEREGGEGGEGRRGGGRGGGGGGGGGGERERKRGTAGSQGESRNAMPVLNIHNEELYENAAVEGEQSPRDLDGAVCVCVCVSQLYMLHRCLQGH